MNNIEQLLKSKGINEENIEVAKELLHLKYIIPYPSRIAPKYGKQEAIEEYLKEHCEIKNVHYYIACMNYGYNEIPKCPICGKPLKIILGGFRKTCGDKECTKKYCEKQCIEQYGVPSRLQAQEIKDKIRATNLERYGNEIPTKNKEVVEKIKNTNLERYGSNCPMSNEEVKETARNNQLKKYGVANISQLEEIKKKKEDASMKHYGCKTPLQAQEIKNKISQTNIANYGVDNPFKSGEFQKTLRRKYNYNGVYFDSSWELGVYIYCKDHDIPIEREPVELEYYSQGQRHLYIPDFKIKDKLVEIKGDMMLDEEGNIKPHPTQYKKNLSEKELRELEELYEDKNRCLKENGVVLLKREDIEECLNYVKNKYGCEYLKKYKA